MRVVRRLACGVELQTAQVLVGGPGSLCLLRNDRSVELGMIHDRNKLQKDVYWTLDVLSELLGLLLPVCGKDITLQRITNPGKPFLQYRWTAFGTLVRRPVGSRLAAQNDCASLPDSAFASYQADGGMQKAYWRDGKKDKN